MALEMYSKSNVDRKMMMVKDDLLRWICERHASDCPLDRHLLRDKALKLASEYGLSGFKCSDKWLNCFLKKHGFSVNLEPSYGPIFNNYRIWVDMIRPIITQYKYKDLFHLDELTMYSDISLNRIFTIHQTMQLDESCESLNKVTVQMCCNASGTEKLPLLICGSYPAMITNQDLEYSHSQNASIKDELFKEWLIRMNDYMSITNRKILLLVNRSRMSAFQGLKLNNMRHVFFPDHFPPLMRPLNRDIFHFVKMIYRSKYAEEIRERGCQWNVEHVARSLLEAWRKVPRALIIASFQRTNFRTDDCFLEIHCDAWKDLEIGISFKKFVTFDDDLSSGVLRDDNKSTSKNHNYNLRTREVIRLVDNPLIINLENDVTDKIYDQRVSNENLNSQLKKISLETNVERTQRNSLKRTFDDAQLNENCCEEIKSEKLHDNLTINSGKQPVIEDDIQLLANSNLKGSNTEAVSCISSRNGNELLRKIDENVNSSLEHNGEQCSKSFKRKQSYLDSIEEPAKPFNDVQPEQKKFKPDSNWAKQYETTFVFGSSDVAQSVSIAPNEAVGKCVKF